MSRILLVHWNREVAEARAGQLRKAGHAATPFSDQTGAGWREVRRDPPEAIVIDLSRLPSHGRAVGTWLRQQKATRHVPLIFITGDPEKTRSVRELLPDAVFTDWRRVRGAVTRAIRKAPDNPAVPGTMAGYSGTPLPRKLGIKSGIALAILGAPSDFLATLGPLPEDVQVRCQARGRSEIVLLFVKSQAELKRRFAPATGALADRGRIWVCWPKKSSGRSGDLGANEVRAFGLQNDFVDFKIGAIDTIWSGLCFTRRRKR